MQTRLHISHLLVLITVSILALSLPCSAAGISSEKIGDYGYIDWLNQTVYAKGLGVAPKDKRNSDQAEALAYRAAVIVAQRNILEVIKGVHIDSTTVVENKIVTDEKVVSSIQGLVRFSTVDYSKQLTRDTVEVGVSMPLWGKLADILITSIEEPRHPTKATATSADLKYRLNDLEQRIQTLENQISGLKKISAEKERLLYLFQELAMAWQTHAVEKPFFINAAYASDADLSALRNQMNDQEKRLAAFSVILTDLSRRLGTLEAHKEMIPRSPTTGKPPETPPYTGLVIDARQIGFKPCLKPTIFCRGEQLYPDEYLDLQKAIKNGYVRYYNNKAQAQQSQRAGSLPYVISAKGTFEGDRSLLVGPQAYTILKAIAESPDNFLANGRVVIVF